MTKKQCPLGDACDLTTAWMAGAAKAQDQIKAQAAEIERLRGVMAKVTAAYRLEAMRRDDYSHADFDHHIAALTGAKP